MAPDNSSTAPTTSLEPLACDLCIIGAGAGGLAVAITAALLGRRVILVEKQRPSGNRRQGGSLSSKAFIASARRAHALQTASSFGIASVHPAVDFAAVREHVIEVAEAVDANSTPERLAALGIRILRGTARFVDKTTLQAAEYLIKARRFVIATGSSPVIPRIPGLDTLPFFTTDTIFDNTRRLDRPIVLGGGPSGLELAQALTRLGSTVTVIDNATMLSSEDPELVAVALRGLRAEGLDLHAETQVDRVEAIPGGGVRVHVTAGDRAFRIEGSHLLLALGRKPGLGELNLSAAGIKTGPNGIVVRPSLKTTNRRIFAIGDAASGPQFAHVATYHAGIVIKRALFGLPATTDAKLIPRVTFIDPELAWVGLNEAEAIKAYTRIQVLRWPFAENDRAMAERRTEGHVKILVGKGGVIVGAGVVGAHAGELIQPWSLAIAKGLTVKDMTDWIAPYPTLGEINWRAAVRGLSATPVRPFTRWLAGLFGRLR